MMRSPSMRRLLWPFAIYLATTAVYLGFSADRLLSPSSDNHYVHLANSWLNLQLHLPTEPPGTNDWACYDTVERGPCPNLRWHFDDQGDRYRFFVSFPPFPAALMLPVVALFGVGALDRLFWALLAGLGPAMLFVALRAFREGGHSTRSLRDDVWLTALFAFGTVYFFSAVQGSVWFAAHIVATISIGIYLWASVDARRPFVAGLAIALCFLTRPTTALLSLFFVLEAMRVSRLAPLDGPLCSPRTWLKDLELSALLARLIRFAALPALALAIALVLNEARFDDPFEFGHRYLQIYWRPRIERWGLFNYHYLGRNLAVFLASLPWLLDAAPFVRISRHGLALWVTTPNLLFSLWPKQLSATMVALWCAIAAVASVDLLYQNSGWVQFGYRFALDYLPLWIVTLALSGRPRRGLFMLLLFFSVAVNLFGAVTFDRIGEFYDSDPTQRVLFQPD